MPSRVIVVAPCAVALLLAVLLAGGCGKAAVVVTPTAFLVCTAPGLQGYPAVSGSTVIWQDDRDDESAIYGYDLTSKTEFEIGSTAVGGGKSMPDISGNIVVWADSRNGNSDIYGYDLARRKEFAICTAPGCQQCPVVSGSIVVRQDYRDEQPPNGLSIYGYDLKRKKQSASARVPGSAASRPCRATRSSGCTRARCRRRPSNAMTLRRRPSPGSPMYQASVGRRLPTCPETPWFALGMETRVSVCTAVT